MAFIKILVFINSVSPLTWALCQREFEMCLMADVERIIPGALFHFKTHLSHFCSVLDETQALSGKTEEFRLIVSRLEHERFSSSTVPCYIDVKTLSSLPPFVSPAATGLRTHRWVTIVTVYYITAFYITCFLPVCPHSCCLKWAVKYYQICIFFLLLRKIMVCLHLHFSAAGLKPEPRH